MLFHLAGHHGGHQNLQDRLHHNAMAQCWNSYRSPAGYQSGLEYPDWVFYSDL